MVQKAKIKVLLTGASGFIGKNFLELAPKYIEIIAVYNKSDLEKFVKDKRLKNVKLYKCDLTNKEDTRRLAENVGAEIDNCIYLAGNVNIPLSIKNPSEDLKSNVIGLINFIESFSKIKKFIYMSSAAVYEGNKGIVTTKSMLSPYIPYSISKLTAEHYVNYFYNTGKIDSYIILRFGGAYGLYSERKFVSQLVRDILQNKKTIKVYGDGTNIVNLMYVKDTVKSLLACMRSKKSNLICNLGQDNMTITQLVNRAANIFDKKVKIKYTPRRQDQKYINFKLKVDFNRIFNFEPDYSFESGIREFASLMENEN